MTLLGEALASHGHPVPVRLGALDRAMERAPVPPSDLEYSARIDGALSPWRATYYFDLAGFGPAGSVEIADLRPFLEHVAQVLEVPEAAALAAAWTTASRTHGGVDQLVIGLDERDDDRRSRVKLYLVLHGEQSAWLEASRVAVALPAVPIPRGHEGFFILGMDLAAAADVKLYRVVDRGTLTTTVSGLEPVREVLLDSKALALRECLHSDRQQVIFQVMHPRGLQALLSGRASEDAAFAELSERVARMDCVSEPIVWSPRLAAFSVDDGCLDLHRVNLYFHPARGIPREPPHPLGTDPWTFAGGGS